MVSEFEIWTWKLLNGLRDWRRCYWGPTVECQKSVGPRLRSVGPQMVAGHWGSQQEHIKFYEETLEAGPMVMQWIREGYRIPLIQVPPVNIATENNVSALKEQEFMEAEILKLLEMGVVEEVFQPPHIVNPLSVVFSNKWR